ncbi:MAG: hypothetical protein VX026_02195, partial [Myxococcota bacterium]|nr:hypothetical protein [Myxococcota bacterium]
GKAISHTTSYIDISATPTLAASYMASERVGYFRYGVLGWDTNVSGTAYYPGWTQALRKDCDTDSWQMAAVYVHELGHNMGLGHGGLSNSCNYKPNYPSIMNYRYTLEGQVHPCAEDERQYWAFSDGHLPDLNESSLDESVGFCGDSAYDWNGNGVIENGVSADLNSQDPTQGTYCGGTVTTLTDVDDWGGMFIGLGLPSPNSYIPMGQPITCTFH